MSSRKEIGNTSNFVTVKEAASISSYAPAYLTRLAKKGVLKAKKDGQRWLIEVASIKKYLSSLDSRKVPSRVRMGVHKINTLNKTSYAAAAWAFHKAQTGAFDPKAVLESLAIAGLSSLIAVIVQGYVSAGASPADLYGGAVLVAESLNEPVRVVASNLSVFKANIEVDALMASVLSLFF
jgi:hypothetical protein